MSSSGGIFSQNSVEKRRDQGHSFGQGVGTGEVVVFVNYPENDEACLIIRPYMK